MPLCVGDNLGPYEILAPLGEGGMGEVWKARDTRLDRIVALKVSREEFSERFNREARAVAALNHPNICALYDVGPNYLVMEFADGPMLSQRMQKGPIALADAEPILRQLIDAIEAAHEKGIIHRDLKPANIKISGEGVLKVLDFGLAKAEETLQATRAEAVTITTATLAGVIMGTPGYMSPEQARGLPVDKRTDIWACGVILYELVTGKRLFDGPTVSDTLAAVLTKEIDTSGLPAPIGPLIRRCLERDPRIRLRDIGDARLFLALSTANAPPAKPTAGWWPWVAAVCAAGMIATLGIHWWSGRPVEKPLVRFDIELGTGLTVSGMVALSPDGQHLAFFGTDAKGRVSLLARRLDEAKPVILLDGFEGNPSQPPFFSPDSKWIGFAANRKLQKIRVEGGSPVPLSDSVMASARSSWSDTGEITSALTFQGLFRIPVNGGAPQLLPETYDPLGGPRGGAAACYLPGTNTLLIARGSRGLFVYPASGPQRQVSREITDATAVDYLPGYVLCLDQQSTLNALPFDARTLQSTGAPFPVLRDIDTFSASLNGTILLRRGRVLRTNWTLQWLDESGTTQPILEKPGLYLTPSFSPDGNQLAVAMGPPPETIWIQDLHRDSMTQLATGRTPVWMPDGKYLLFSNDDGIYVVSANGEGKPRRILEGKALAESVSPDSKTLSLTKTGDGTQRDIWMVPLEGSGDSLRAGKPTAFIHTKADEFQAMFSPDGKWVAYSSNDAEGSQVHVRAASGQGRKWKVSREEAFRPSWAPGGKELFYQVRIKHDLMTVPYTVEKDVFTPGPPKMFTTRKTTTPGGATKTYAVAPQGDKIAIILPAQESTGAESQSNYTVMFNFLDELKRRASKANRSNE